MSTDLIFWIAFIAIFLIVFTIDMFVTGHRKEKVPIRTALYWTGLWISIALLYGAAIYFFYPQGETKAMEFISGYLTEYSLSVDNLFVFIMIFSVMAVKEKNQPRMLKLGILLSIFLRITFILFGVEMIHRFHFVIYVFGAILLYTAYKMAFMDDEQIDPHKNLFYKTASKYFPVDTNPEAVHFFSRRGGKLHITTLSLVFLLIGTTDIVFALDSIPAILGITTDSFVVITSNVFAVLGLISLFFALEGIMGMFRFLKNGVALILVFVGIKMLISKVFAIPTQWSLAFIAATILSSILLSVIIQDDKSNLQKEKVEK